MVFDGNSETHSSGYALCWEGEEEMLKGMRIKSTRRTEHALEFPLGPLSWVFGFALGSSGPEI